MLRFWGKERRRGSDLDGDYHPAAYHCLDVAASAHALLSANTLLRSRLAEALGIPESDTLSLVTAWAALHDVGKFSAPF